MSTELQTRPTVSLSLALSSLPEIRAFCEVLAKTSMVPKAYQGKPDDILVAGLQGQKLGLDIFQAMQSIATINGVPSIYGDAGLAIVRSSGKLEDFDEWIEVEGVRQEGPFPITSLAEENKSIVAYCMSKRAGMSRPRTTTYSVLDAKRAQLWGKPGPWTNTPQRMLMFRARGWNLRDNFGDYLKGMAMFEEAMDIDTAPGPDGTYRPVVVATVDEDQADLADVQAKLKAQRDAQVQGDGLNGAPAVSPPSVEAPPPPVSQDAPAPAAKPALADPFKRFGTAKIEQPEWEAAIAQIRTMPDWNTLVEDWRVSRNVKDPSRVIAKGQQDLLAYMREKIGPAFPY